MIDDMPSLSTLLAGYDLVPKPALTHAETVRFVRLNDGTGAVNLMIGSASLLDLDEVERFSGRPLLPAPQPELSAFTALADRHTLLLADRSLFEAEALALDDPETNTSLGISGADLSQLVLRHDLCSGGFAIARTEIDQRCNNTELDVADIHSAIGQFTTRRIKQRIEDTLDFPPLPEIANRIVKIGANPHATVADLAQVVELDPSLSAQVVSWASSPYYAAPGKVKTIDDAILRVLGFDLVMNMALGLALGKALKMPKDGRYGYRAYWVQAVDGAAVMEALIKAMPADRRPPVGTGYLIGLLHNFGLLMLSELMKPQLLRICSYSEANAHAGHPTVEKHLLGATREQMAALLMKFWNLPDEVRISIRHQHDAHYHGEHAVYAHLLFVTTRMLGGEGIGTAPREPIPDALLNGLGLSRAVVDEIAERVLNGDEDLKHIASALAA